jgi:hypothetical protein
MKLYLVGWRAEGPTKIGIARHVPSRVEALQTACPYRLKAFATFATFHAEDMERELLKRLATVRLSGEWVSLGHKAIEVLARSVAKENRWMLEQIGPGKTRAQRKRVHDAVSEARYFRDE